MTGLERFDYTFRLDAGDGPVEEAVLVRGQPDQETARDLVPERLRRRIVTVDETPEQRRVSVHDLQLLVDLIERPEWLALRNVCEQLMDRHFRRLAREFATKGAEPDYAQLQWQRGVFAGIKAMLDEPHKIANPRRLERLLDQEDD